MNLIPAVSGFWPDNYMCTDKNILETINRMLSNHAPDFPNTCCIGFTITQEGNLFKIWPKVKTSKFVHDFYTGERI
jgi:hypothetical protein